jgi:hypothetical protein
VDRHLAQDGGTSVWAVCMSYEAAGDSRAPAARRAKVDYRDVPSETDFTLYARPRSLRKEIAEVERVPLYAPFTCSRR